MLKIALIIFVIVVLAGLFFMLYQSYKMLRQVQKQEARENKNIPKPRQLHPKFQQNNKSQD